MVRCGRAQRARPRAGCNRDTLFLSNFLINNALYDAFRRVYGGQVRCEPDNYSGYSGHRPDLAVLLDGELTVFGLKVFDPIGSLPADVSERGAHVAFGNTAEHANDTCRC